MSAVPTTPEGKKRLVIKTTLYSYTILIRELTLRDCTVDQLVEISGLHRITVGNILRAFHRLELIHVCRWNADGKGRDTIAIYRWGCGIDAKRRKLTDAERSKRARDKKKRLAELKKSSKKDLTAIEKGLKSELAKTKPATSAGLGYSVFVQANLGHNGSCS